MILKLKKKTTQSAPQLVYQRKLGKQILEKEKPDPSKLTSISESGFVSMSNIITEGKEKGTWKLR